MRKGSTQSLYGVFFDRVPVPTWALSRNKRRALQRARRDRGYVVEVRNAYAWGAPSAWDAPTFRVTGELIADYR